jgi:glycosyltransferase involved in cell wall biosynthesis
MPNEAERIFRVMMFCPQFRPIVGGAERQVEKLAIALVEQGCQVTVLTPRLDADSPDQEELKGVVIERFQLNDLSRRFSTRGIAVLNIPYILWQIVSAVMPRVQGMDVLHCHIASLQTAGAALAGRIVGVPVLLKAAVADQRSDLGEIEKNGFSGSLVAWLVCSLIQLWVATTGAVEEALIRAGVKVNKIVRIPNGVELPNNPNFREPVTLVSRFLYLGRLSANTQRDIPTLIRAFECLSAIHPDVELAIVGDGDLFEEARALARARAARNRIQLPGTGDAEKWLTWADCFVLPSRREGLSNALLEAMAAGLPCIANDIPPNREVLDDGGAGMLVPIGDTDALVLAMQTLIENPDTNKKYQKIARKRVEDYYTIASVAAHYIKLYSRMISNENQ